MSEDSAKVWVDGVIREGDQAGVPLLAHTLHYGVGVFEGIRAYSRANGQTSIFRLHEHIVRLFNSCKLVLIEPKVNKEQVRAGCLEVLRANAMTEAYLRPIVYLGEGGMGLLPTNNPVTTAIAAWSWGAYLGKEGLTKGIRCKISSFCRQHIGAGFPQGKISGQYVNSVAAKLEATRAGYDEAILLDSNGFVAEGSGENIFVARDGELLTPPVSAGILPGLTRATVMTLAREAGIHVSEQPFTRDELYLADEVFFTGTAAEVTPVREIDDRAVAKGEVGPLTRQLQQRYFDVVRGNDTTHPEWLTYL